MTRPRKKPRAAILISKDPREQIDAFVDAVLTLEGREPSPDEWRQVYGLFGGVRRLLPKSTLDGFWAKSRDYRAGDPKLRQSRVFKAFAEFGRLRDAAWKRHAKESGYWSRIHDRRKATADPEKFRADAADRKRKSRARKREVEKQLAVHPEPNVANDIIATVLEALDAAE